MDPRLTENSLIKSLADLTAPLTEARKVPVSARLVFDTNIVLDLFYWGDARVGDLKQALASKAFLAVISRETLAELIDVLLRAPFLQTPEQIQAIVLSYLSLSCRESDREDLCPVRCKDVNDQKFLNLATQCACPLITRDKHLLKLAKKMRRFGVHVTTPEKL